MISVSHPQVYSFCRISEVLRNCGDAITPDSGNRTRAAVAMILHQAGNDLEILFIQRSADDNDPWSGHIAFPGGKLENGELECQAACRETLEEIGVDLEDGHFLGRLSDIIGANLPVRVSCCVYAVDRTRCLPVLSDEVSDLFWISLSELRDAGRHVLETVTFDDRRFDVPAIRLSLEGKPVLWGITYRLVMQFLDLLNNFDQGIANSGECSTLPESVELIEED